MVVHGTYNKILARLNEVAANLKKRKFCCQSVASAEFIVVQMNICGKEGSDRINRLN